MIAAAAAAVSYVDGSMIIIITAVCPSYTHRLSAFADDFTSGQKRS
jgi:hypothetical protein